MDNFKLENGVLYISGEKIELPGIVKKVIEHKGLIISAYDYRSNISENVLSFDRSGKITWTIERCDSGKDLPLPYTNIWIDADDNLMAYNARGCNYKVNIKDGTVELWPPKQRPW